MATDKTSGVLSIQGQGGVMMATVQPTMKNPHNPEEGVPEFSPSMKNQRTLGGKLFACVWSGDNHFFFWDSSSPSNQSLIVL